MRYDVVKLTSKGQMTLPVGIRRRLNLKEGDHLALLVEGRSIRLQKIEPVRPLSAEDPIWELVGAGESGRSDVSAQHDRHLAEGEVSRWHKS